MCSQAAYYVLAMVHTNAYKKSCLIYIKQLFLLPEKDSNLHKQNQNLSSYP